MVVKVRAPVLLRLRDVFKRLDSFEESLTELFWDEGV